MRRVAGQLKSAVPYKTFRKRKSAIALDSVVFYFLFRTALRNICTVFFQKIRRPSLFAEMVFFMVYPTKAYFVS